MMMYLTGQAKKWYVTTPYLITLGRVDDPLPNNLLEGFIDPLPNIVFLTQHTQIAQLTVENPPQNIRDIRPKVLKTLSIVLRQYNVI